MEGCLIGHYSTKDDLEVVKMCSTCFSLANPEVAFKKIQNGEKTSKRKHNVMCRLCRWEIVDRDP